MSIVNRIRELARQKNVTISGIEKEIGLSNGIIGKWQKQSPSCEKLKLVADYLNTSVDYLLTGDEKKESELTENEIELLEAFSKFSDREQIKIVAQLEMLAEQNLTKDVQKNFNIKENVG